MIWVPDSCTCEKGVSRSDGHPFIGPFDLLDPIIIIDDPLPPVEAEAAERIAVEPI